MDREFKYEGKAKKVYRVVGKSNEVIIEFKDSLTAFNAQKTGSFAGKGQVNLELTTVIYNYLTAQGVATHLLKKLNDNELLCKEVHIVPIEVVVRNKLAGSTAKKFGISEGQTLKQPLVEFYYKSDSLQDPFMSDDQALMLGITTPVELVELKSKALQINQSLIGFFQKCGLDLVDFKIEFGRTSEGALVLADEITPDTCRLWDVKTGEKLDKDRFRRDLGNVAESYREVLERIKKHWSQYESRR